MGLFKRKSRVIDLSEKYREHQERASQIKKKLEQEKQKGSESALSFLGNLASSGSSMASDTETDSSFDSPEMPGEKRKRLAKRLMDMTDKIEDLSNQIYHLQQRIDLLEKKIMYKD